ncbi:MAG: hypothetical protein KDD42_04355, partial [Bdellovibrionales bacterium]|nr:hypothetical protein [Bdellovibrionales bacterium]
MPGPRVDSKPITPESIGSKPTESPTPFLPHDSDIQLPLPSSSSSAARGSAPSRVESAETVSEIAKRIKDATAHYNQLNALTVLIEGYQEHLGELGKLIERCVPDGDSAFEKIMRKSGVLVRDIVASAHGAKTEGEPDAQMKDLTNAAQVLSDYLIASVGKPGARKLRDELPVILENLQRDRNSLVGGAERRGAIEASLSALKQEPRAVLKKFEFQVKLLDPINPFGGVFVGAGVEAERERQGGVELKTSGVRGVFSSIGRKISEWARIGDTEPVPEPIYENAASLMALYSLRNAAFLRLRKSAVENVLKNLAGGLDEADEERKRCEAAQRDPLKELLITNGLQSVSNVERALLSIYVSGSTVVDPERNFDSQSEMLSKLSPKELRRQINALIQRGLATEDIYAALESIKVDYVANRFGYEPKQASRITQDLGFKELLGRVIDLENCFKRMKRLGEVKEAVREGPEIFSLESADWVRYLDELWYAVDLSKEIDALTVQKERELLSQRLRGEDFVPESIDIVVELYHKTLNAEAPLMDRMALSALSSKSDWWGNCSFKIPVALEIYRFLILHEKKAERRNVDFYVGRSVSALENDMPDLSRGLLPDTIQKLVRGGNLHQDRAGLLSIPRKPKERRLAYVAR